MGGNLAALYDDMHLSPEKYNPETVALVSNLVSSKRDPTEKERQQLDLAVYDFNQPKQPRPSPPKQAPRPAAKRAKSPTAPAATLPVTAPVGAKSTSAFWWLGGK